MSRWSLMLFGLVVAASPLAAQENPWRNSVETAPMPRAKHGAITFGIGLSPSGVKMQLEGVEWDETPEGAIVGKHPITPGQALERLGTLMRPGHNSASTGNSQACPAAAPAQPLVATQTRGGPYRIRSFAPPADLAPTVAGRALVTPVFEGGSQGVPMPFAQFVHQPPSDSDVLKALKTCPNESCEEVLIVKKLIKNQVDAPCCYPSVGVAQLHRITWECTVYITEVTETPDPLPIKVSRKRIEVVYIDKDALQPAGQECAKGQCTQKKPAYMVEAPDELLIEVQRRTRVPQRGADGQPQVDAKGQPVMVDGTKPLPIQPINGRFQVRPDGTVGFGFWGCVQVSGMTLDEISAAIRMQLLQNKQLIQIGDKPEEIVVIVDVVAYKSKRYYVLTDSGEGEQVYAFPITGSETVLDALSCIFGKQNLHCDRTIWVARPGAKGQPAKVLHVDCNALKRGEENHLLQAGDRVYVQAVPVEHIHQCEPVASPVSKAPVQACTGPLAITAGVNANAGYSGLVALNERNFDLGGTWYREMPGAVTALAFKNGELTVTLKLSEGGKMATATITAEYSVAKDGTVYGVFTGADVTLASGVETDGMELAGLSMQLQTLVDQPFAARCRPTEGSLMLSKIRFLGAQVEMNDQLASLCGKFTKAEKGVVPAPKASTAIRPVGQCDLAGPPGCVVPCMPVPYAPAVSYGLPSPPVSYGPPSPARSIYTSPPQLVDPALQPPCVGPSCPPPEVQAMMMQAFGQLGAPTPPQPCYPACPTPTVAPAAYAPPIPIMPPIPTATAKPASSMPLGTWIREVGPIRYKLEVKENHLTATVTETGDNDGKAIVVDHILTVDCYPTRNPGEIVGLISGFDMSVSGKDLEGDDIHEFLKELPVIQKEMSGKPVAFTFRVYDDALLIGNVRLPFSKNDENDGFLSAFQAFGGRYKLSNGMPPLKPTPAKRVKTARDSDAPAERIGGDFSLVPPMSQPLALPESEPVKKRNPFRDGGL
jgi:protein involved in polysaccharide export with SLBB domain